MATLYTLHLSHHKPGMVKGPVKAVRADFAGHWRECEKEIVRPDMDALRACLPHYYRKAWDRRGNSMWFPQDNGPAYATLRISRGKYLNTIYAQPYDFTVDTAV